MKKWIFYGLLIILAITILFELYFVIVFGNIVGHYWPDHISLLYVIWQDSYDTFLAIPNFFLIPLILMGFYVLFTRVIMKPK